MRITTPSGTTRQRPRPSGAWIPLLGVFLFALPLLSPGPGVPDLVGTWAAEGVQVRFLRQGGFVMVDQRGDETRTLRGVYVLETSKRPIALTIRGVPGLSRPLHASIAFVDANTLHISPFADERRRRALTLEPDVGLLLERKA